MDGKKIASPGMTAQPVPLIEESRARQVRKKGVDAAERLLDVIDLQIGKLKEITAAEPSLAEQIAAEGAAKAIERQMMNIPALLELAKEAANPLTKIVGILRSEAPIPGEPKSLGSGLGVESPHEPEEISLRESIATILKVYDEPKAKRTKKRRKTG